jgi:phosphoglycerate dehydrogenase-like enzyme
MLRIRILFVSIKLKYNILGGITMKTKVGINGFGRIGRNAFKDAWQKR